MNNPYNWTGNSWRLFPAIKNNQLNVVKGVELISGRLIHLLLLAPGDDPIHPELGFAPDIFSAKSNRSATKFTSDLADAIQKWNRIANLGLLSFNLNTVDLPSSNEVIIELSFVPIFDYQEHTLSFEYWQYGRVASVEDFLASVKIDRQVFSF